MSTEPDLQFRNNPVAGIVPLLSGAVVGGFSVVGLFSVIFSGKHDLGTTNGLGVLGFVVMFNVVSLWWIVVGYKQMFDKTTKLSISPQGIRDHRTEITIRWPDYRGVRLYLETTNDTLSKASMFVMAVRVDVCEEIEFDVIDLDHDPETITQIVRDRGLSFLRSAAASQKRDCLYS